jgi:hypothetical protein
MKLNILNGQSMYDRINKNKDEMYIPFNEAICDGKIVEPLFENKFITERSKNFEVSVDQYKLITMTHLKPLFEGKFDEINLFFGNDMFCMINMLTLITLLPKNIKTFINIVDEETDEVLIKYELNDVVPFKHIFKDTIINHEETFIRSFPEMDNAISLFLDYIKDNSEINEFIIGHMSYDENKLIEILMEKFPNYGLGDTQYLELIRKQKKRV